MKKVVFYILALCTILIQSSMIHEVSAQEITGVATNVDVDTACEWTGAPGLSTSDLNVPTGAVCVILTTMDASDVTVATGGTLIIRSVSVDTTFTVYDSVNIQGITEIGVTGDSGNASFYTTNSTDFTIASGTVETMSSSATNTLNVDGMTYVYNDGTLTNSGVYTTIKLMLGNSGGTPIPGGTITNKSGGEVYVTSSLSDAAAVYRGSVYNEAGATDFDINGTLTFSAISGDSNLFETYSTTNLETVNIQDYTLLDIKGGTTNTKVLSLIGTGGYLETDLGAILNISGNLNINYGGVVNDGVTNILIGSDLNMDTTATGTVDNNKDFIISGDIILDDYSIITNDDYMSAGSLTMDNSEGGANPIVHNNGTMDLTGDITMHKGPQFNNNSVLNLDGNLIIGDRYASTPSAETSLFSNSTLGTATLNLTNGELQMWHKTILTNWSAGTINLDPTGTIGSGKLLMNTSESLIGLRPEVRNYGAFNVRSIVMGSPAILYGGYFTNESSSADLVITLPALDGVGLNMFFGAKLLNYNKATVSVNKVGLTGTSASVEERVYINNTSTATGAFEINANLIVDSHSIIQNSGTFNSNDPNYSYQLSSSGNEILNSGTMTLNGPATLNQDVNIDISDGGVLNIEGNLTFSGNANIDVADYGQLNVAGNLDQNFPSTLAAGYLNPTNYGEINITGTSHIGGIANIDGTLDTATHLHLESSGIINQGLNSVVTVTGSETIVDGDYELDGTLNAGNLTVNTGGVIHSGVGIETNFLINAVNVTVTALGKISSDNASTRDRSGTGGGGGSNGGQGVDVSGTPTTALDYTKISSPYYGEQGEFVGGSVSSNGGGGVRIVATGNILLSGEITANGETPTTCTTANGGAGAGGGIIITHNPSSSSATFSGAGYIKANGGNGYSGVNTCYPGGGGRIVIDSPLLDDPDDDNATAPHYQFNTSHIEAYGGSVNGYAAAGTIAYLGDPHNSNDTVIIDQGGIAPTGNTKSQIPGTTTQIQFSRIEARDAAVVTFVNDPGVTYAPTVCYDEDNGSSITLVQDCDTYSLPDKPDTLFINNGYPGTTDNYANGNEPYIGGPITNLLDINPQISVIYRHPEAPAVAADTLQLVIDDSSDFSSPIWTKTVSSITQQDESSVYDGDRTQDVEYDGATLSLDTPYYIRARFSDGSTYGVWSHLDIGDYYQFQIDESFSITSSCATTDTIIITDYTGGGNINNSDGDRYGKGTCDFTISSTATGWKVLYGKAYNDTSFDDGAANDINDIDNGSRDCTIDFTGNTAEEEYGFNISTTDPLIVSGMNRDSDCFLDTGLYPDACGTDGFSAFFFDQDCIFDIKNFGFEDMLFGTQSGTVTNAPFTLNLHANVDGATALSTYNLKTNLIILPTP